MSQSKVAIVAAYVRFEVWYSEIVTMTSRHHLTEEPWWQAIGRLEAGKRKFSQGQLSPTTRADDRYLSSCARRNGTATSAEFGSSLGASSGRLASRSTMSQKLCKSGFYVSRLNICVPLTSSHRREHLQWVCQHVPWTHDQWRVVLFTEKSRYAYGSGSVCIWGGISLVGRTVLYVFSCGNVNADTYRDDILDAYRCPYARAIGVAFVLLDDNARPHMTRIVDAYLEQEIIQRL
ncbi:transposable element Tcb1 transposase [Trichonephila clavipes]|nr:transposable element Tcb1 transposase [Trichonephila clavipes]